MTRGQADPRRAEIDAAVLVWMREPDWRDDDERFERLARELFAFQFEHCEAYARFCRARGVEPRDVDSWRAIPAVPTGAFKEVALRSFAQERTCRIFRTSGTSTERRGELHLDTLELYEASLLASIGRCLVPELRDPAEVETLARMSIRVLAPAAEAAPDSSLSHMFGCLLDAVRAAGGSGGFDVRAASAGGDAALDVDGLLAALEAHLRQRDPGPVLVCGTAFAFVHLIDALDARKLVLPELPAGSRAMETGGFKGRARELPRDELRARIARSLGLPERRVVNQYGMTELGSQFYDSVLVDPLGPRRKLAPPWVRVRLVDPETGAEAKPGEPGLVRIVDLANTGSVAAVQTADLARWIEAGVAAADAPERGFDVLGRAEGAEARGCSIAADTMLAGTS